MIKSTFTAALISVTLTAGAAQADNVEIYLQDMLDNTQVGYCIDVAKGRGKDANPDDGLQGHTCYSPGGEIGYDQAFDPDKFAEGLLYMVNFDVCTQTTSTEAGSALELAACDGSEAQSFVFSGEGTIVPAAAPEMCMTVAQETRSGRSDVNQIKVLSLEPCSDDQAAYQNWNVRSSLD